MQERFSFTPILGLLLTALCALIFIGSLSAILMLPLSSFIWAAITSILYVAVVMVHSEFAMKAISEASVRKAKDESPSGEPIRGDVDPSLHALAKPKPVGEAALADVDPSAASLKVNLDVLMVVPFLYGLFRLCCGGPSEGSKEK